MEGRLRGVATIKALPTSQIDKLLRVINKVGEGRINLRDVDRRDMDSIRNLMAAYGMLQ